LINVQATTLLQNASTLQANILAWNDTYLLTEAISAGTLLDPHVLTVGFARRFTAYKRPTLILHDLDRLQRLLADPLRP
ncbi:hypothetical protein Q6279_29815, partial [Klebsiella variicola]|nr:hypothetical protein [Klebsiella variicola]